MEKRRERRKYTCLFFHPFVIDRVLASFKGQRTNHLSPYLKRWGLEQRIKVVQAGTGKLKGPPIGVKIEKSLLNFRQFQVPLKWLRENVKMSSTGNASHYANISGEQMFFTLQGFPLQIFPSLLHGPTLGR